MFGAGQVEILVTDKTGTLTKNKMVLRNCFINGVDYAHDVIDETRGRILANVGILKMLESQHDSTRMFILGLTICNTVTVESQVPTLRFGMNLFVLDKLDYFLSRRDRVHRRVIG